MNGFSYVENEKKIVISDGKDTVTWENVEKNIAEEAAKKYENSESIDDFLLKHGCNRFWSTK